MSHSEPFFQLKESMDEEEDEDEYDDDDEDEDEADTEVADNERQCVSAKDVS